jgi:sulfur carrier protein
MIPSEPDPDNTGEGKRRTYSFRHSAPPIVHFVILQLNVMIEVSINQQKFSFPDAGTLADVLPALQISQADGIAIALNETVIPRREWERHVLRAKDRIFVIRATQGG